MYPLGAELELVHLAATLSTDLVANTNSVAASRSTPSGGVYLRPFIKSFTSFTKDSLSAGTSGPVSWKDTRSGRREERKREKVVKTTNHTCK